MNVHREVQSLERDPPGSIGVDRVEDALAGQGDEQVSLHRVTLAQAGKTNKKGDPNLLRAAVILREYGDVLCAAPLFVQQVLVPPLTVVRMLPNQGMEMAGAM